MKGWSFHSLKDGFASYQQDWEALNARLNASHPLLCVDFVKPLIHHFAGPDDHLATHASARGVDALVALTSDQLRWQSFKPGQAQLSPTLLTDSKQAAALLGALPSRVLMLDLLCLDPLQNGDLLSSNPALGERTAHATTIKVKLEGTFNDYWLSRPKRLQGDVQNKLNRLQKDGVVLECRQHIEPEAIAQALTRYSATENTGWKGAEGTAVVMGTPQGDFYSEVMQRFAARKAASVFELWLNGELAASQMTIRGGGMSIHMKTTHNEDLGRYAPGYLLGYHILQHEFETKRVGRVEYYTDADQYKRRWGTAQRTIHHERLFRHALARSLVQGVQKFKLWGKAAEPEMLPVF